jgi:rare lipoprotein A
VLITRAAALLIGLASVYSTHLTGKPMTNGHPYRPEAHTVAHRTLPLGTCLLITTRHHAAFAEVTDRGPFVRGRSLDVSAAVARELNLSGVGRVTYQVTNQENCMEE